MSTAQYAGQSGAAGAPPPAERPRRIGKPYTGVVVIHGIGNETKNETLQEALNALSYWFNHTAGFSLRDSGPDRVWIQTHLLEVNDPDTRASRATIELSGSAAPGDAIPELYLEMREVWWAQGFGLPPTGAALSWAQVQLWQELGSMLSQIGAGISMPARMLLRRGVSGPRESSAKIGENPAGAFADPPAGQSHFLPGIVRMLLYILLAIYDAVQAVWKTAQWILGVPLIVLLLWIAGIVRALAPVPGFSSLLKGVAALIESVSLHWIAAMQVYLLDYTDSTSLRERFQQQLQPFLADKLCTRIVVIAHSMGVVLAYEGLTAALEQQWAAATEKDITFISLGQALHRIWPLDRTDPHRLRGVLPRSVRWLNFWARYDPVAAGDLGPKSLPPARDWNDPDEPSPDPKLRQSLALVENVKVVNHDSLFTDHISYWVNAEQVIGPIACELVRGSPGIQQRALRNLASADRVLLRQWSVAWHGSLDMAAGAVAGIVLGYFAIPNARLGYAIVADLGVLLGSIGFVSTFFSLIGGLLHSLVTGNNPMAQMLASMQPLAAPASHACYGVVTVIVILLVVALVVDVMRMVFPIPAPFVFHGPSGHARVAPVTPKPPEPAPPQPVMPTTSPARGGGVTGAG